ncbi:bys protein [Uncinocarpus reesii 1704]|uniref:Bys protein n=1 Tax=Uncinocarpus reesii (strain UAMH 1704) TaxID=336963 RepID=C4JGM2_UNCRE|nr:bys protein [Uncinocarpus reesii 1704]EEP77685.1 bys protein [Uncinocarpus reesii 1704]
MRTTFAPKNPPSANPAMMMTMPRDDHYIDAKSSRKILQIGQDLAEEEEAEQRAAEAARRPAAANSAFNFESRFGRDSGEGSDEEGVGKFGEDEGEWEDEEEIEEIEVDPTDLDMFHKFVGRDDEDPIFNPRQSGGEEEGQGTNLADLILEKIAAFEAKQAGQPAVIGGGLPEDAVQIPMKAVEVYEKVGLLLSRYKSGPLPKPFKILPTLPYWDTLLDITQPDKWTPNTIYAATRIFISAKPHIAQQFISIVLLDRVREEIRENKKLNEPVPQTSSFAHS